MPHRPNNTVVFVGGVVLLFLLLLASIAAAWHAGFFRFTGDAASATVVAAALAAVGAFFGAVLSLVGLLVTSTIEERNLALAAQTEARLALDSARNHVLEREAEKRLQVDSERNSTLKEAESDRLKLEAGIRAVQLFATASGTPSPRIQVDGALFTLSSLGYHELTVILTERLLLSKEVDGNTASLLIDRALRYGSGAAQSDAIVIIYHQPDAFFMPRYVTLPSVLVDSPDRLPEGVRWHAALALGNVFAARSITAWRTMTGDLNALTQMLINLWLTKDTSEQVKQDTAAVLRHVLAPYPDLDSFYNSEGPIDRSEILEQTRTAEPISHNARDVVARLRTWSGLQAT
jgi:hypothetical protein